MVRSEQWWRRLPANQQRSGRTVRECCQSPSSWASDHAQRVVRISACGQLADLNQPSSLPIAPPDQHAASFAGVRRRQRSPPHQGTRELRPARHDTSRQRHRTPSAPPSADRPAGTAGDMGSSDAYEHGDGGGIQAGVAERSDPGGRVGEDPACIGTPWPSHRGSFETETQEDSHERAGNLKHRQTQAKEVTMTLMNLNGHQ